MIVWCEWLMIQTSCLCAASPSWRTPSSAFGALCTKLASSHSVLVHHYHPSLRHLFHALSSIPCVADTVVVSLEEARPEGQPSLAVDLLLRVGVSPAALVDIYHRRFQSAPTKASLSSFFVVLLILTHIFVIETVVPVFGSCHPQTETLVHLLEAYAQREGSLGAPIAESAAHLLLSLRARVAGDTATHARLQRVYERFR